MYHQQQPPQVTVSSLLQCYSVPGAAPAVCQRLLQGVAGDTRGSVSFLFHPIPTKMRTALGQTRCAVLLLLRHYPVLDTAFAVCWHLLQGVAGDVRGNISFLFHPVPTKMRMALGQTRCAVLLLLRCYLVLDTASAVCWHLLQGVAGNA